MSACMEVGISKHGINILLWDLRLEYEYEIEYEYDFSDPERILKIIT